MGRSAMTFPAHGERPLSRKEGKAVTRTRLLDAALAILDDEGEAGLTTTSVTRRAGIAQSSFYVHFADMDDLVHALIDELTVRRLRQVREVRRQARTVPYDADALRATFRVPIQHAVEHPQIFRLLVRSRYDRSTALGEWSRAALEEDRRALVEDLHRAGMPRRTAAQRRRAAMVADGLAGLVEALVLGHLEGRYADVDEMIDVLMAFSTGYFPMLTDSPSAVEAIASAWKQLRASRR
ncbi:MAG: TetR family transcriptional regulator [Actinobacteria bacterium]|nr:TetR family transcriptional regulator [Actinomycetota bacterium]